MWYRIAQNIQAIRNSLTSIGASQDVIDYILSRSRKDKITQLIAIVKHNPSITLGELIQESKKTKPRSSGILKRYQSIINKYSNYPDYQKWIQRQINKAEKSNRQINPSVFDYIFDWYKNASEENKNFNIHSYDLQRAIEMSNQFNKVIAGEGEGIIYTPLDRDEYGNIIDDKVVYRFGDGWYMVELDNYNDLATEGNKMNNCSASYWDKVETDKTRMFSLRDPNNNPHVTIELNRNNDIVQTRGNSNSVPSPKLQQKVDEWYKNYKNKENYYKSNEVDINKLNRPYIALEAVRFNPELIKYIDPNIQNYKKIALSAINANPLLLKYIDSDVEDYEEIAMRAIYKDDRCLKYVDVNSPEYTKIALMALSDSTISSQYIKHKRLREILPNIINNPDSFKYLDPNLPEYPQIALYMVLQNAKMLQYVNSKIKEYPTIALEAINKHSEALQYVDKNSEEYQTIVKKALKSNPYIISYVPSNFPGYSQIALDLVKKDGIILRYIDKHIKEYPQIALAAVKQNGMALGYINPQTPGYAQMALVAVKQNGAALEYVDARTPGYEQIALEAVKQNKKILNYIPISIEIILEAIKQKIIQINDIPDEYKSNPEFMEKVKEITNQNVV